MKKLLIILMCSLFLLSALVSCKAEPEVKIQTNAIADNKIFQALGLEAGTYKCETLNFKDGMTFTNEAGTSAFKLAGFTYDNGNFKTTITKAAVSKAATEEKKELTFVPDKKEAVTVTGKECLFKDVKLTCEQIPDLSIEAGADTTVTVPVKEEVTANIHFTLSADWSEGGAVVLKSGTYYSNNTDFSDETTFYSDVECKTEAFKLDPAVYHKGTKLLVTTIKVGTTEKELTFADPTFTTVKDGAAKNGYRLVWFKETGSVNIKDAKTVSGVSFTLSFEKADTTYFFNGVNYLAIIKTGSTFQLTKNDGNNTTDFNDKVFYIKDSVDTNGYVSDTVTHDIRYAEGTGKYTNYTNTIPVYDSKTCEGYPTVYLAIIKDSDSQFVAKIGTDWRAWCSAKTNDATDYDIVTSTPECFDVKKGAEIENIGVADFGAGSCDIEFIRDVKIKFAADSQQ